MTTPSSRIEIVALATDQENTLAAAVELLHHHLTTELVEPWTLTIVDYASQDDTFAVAQRLVSRYVSTRAIRLPQRMDRNALRRLWQSSESATVAFLALAPDRDIGAQLAPLTQNVRPRSVVPEPSPAAGPRQFSRRKALFAVGGVGVLALVAACGKAATTVATNAAASGTGESTISSSSATSSAAVTSATVVLAPEMTEGPYYLDLDLVRSNIVEDRTGAAFALDLVVIDVTTQKPIQGTAVDIWHADANGAYSGFVAASASANGGGSSSSSGSDTTTFLRGTQLSDADGKVSFVTIYPGWYTGRTVHIHVKVHVSGTEIHTGQLFFDDTFTDSVYASNKPYSTRSARNVRNANDSIYSGGGAQSTLLVAKAPNGYAATLPIGVKAS